MSPILIYGKILRIENREKTGCDMKETMIDTEVSYTLQFGDKFFIIEHVPARVCQENGEQYFSPETVEHIHLLIRSQKKPDKVIETPVYRYA